MNDRAWFTIDELNEWADKYHLNAIKKELKRVQLSGEPARIGDVYIKNLEHGLATFTKLVDEFDLTCKRDKTATCYIVEKLGMAYK